MRPLATYGLIAVNLVIYVLCSMQAHSFLELLPSRTFDSSSRILYDGVLFRPYVADGQYWRLLTSGFLHFGVLHVALNMVSLYFLGRDVEIVTGTARFIGIYLTALLGGSAAVMWLADANTVNAGASGAIYGLMGAALILVLKFGLSPTSIITLIVVNIGISVSLPGISLWAHLGGLVFGAAATAGVLVLPERVLTPAARTARSTAIIAWTSIGTLIALAVAASLVRAMMV